MSDLPAEQRRDRPPLRRRCRIFAERSLPIVALAGIAAAIVASGTTPAHAQAQQPARRRQAVRIVQPPRPQFVPSRDRDAEAWLRKARQARSDGEWKLFADTLYRVVTDHESAPVDIDLAETAFASRLVPAYQAAWRLLADAPKEAREAFRAIYEPQARQLLDAALGESARAGEAGAHAGEAGAFAGEPAVHAGEPGGAGSEADLERVVRRYLPTDAGAAALDGLITRDVDQRRWFEALRLIEQAEAFRAPLPRWPLLMRKALACAALRQSERAEASLDEAERLPASAGPADAAERLAQLRALIRDRTELSAVAASGGAPAWSSTCERRAAPELDAAALAVEPQVHLLSRGADIDAGAALTEARKTFRTPVWQALMNAQTLFVTTPNGFVALDPVSLERQWQPFTSALKASREAPPPVNPFGGGVRISRQRGGLQGATRRAVFDAAAGAIAASDEQVVLLEQPAAPGEEAESGGGDIDLLIENSLASYDVRSGKLLWTKGRTGPIEDGLMGAHFFAAATPIGDYFAAPMQLNAELSLLVVDRAGRTIRTVTLGSAPEAIWPVGRLLPPAVSDGEIYFCSGMGAVFALGAADQSVLWCAAYERTPAMVGDARGLSAPAEPSPEEWLDNPPLVCGDLLLVAPCDGRQLLAINRWDGSVRWRTERGSLRYLIAADDANVYVSGGIIQAFSLRPDGPIARSAWEAGGLEVSGRPVLSGGRLLVPTRSGLVVLNAADGSVVERRHAPALAGLGNLLISDGALFSVEFDRVRRFSDPRSELARVAERLAAAARPAPEVRRDRLRGASLLVQMQRWDDALATLDGARLEGAGLDGAGLDGTGAAREGAAAALRGAAAAIPASAAPVEPSEASVRLTGPDADHLRIAALLGMGGAAADRASTDAEQQRACDLLQRADRLASRPDDRFAVATRLAHLDRDRGRPADAFDRMLRLLDVSADTPMPAGARRRVRAAIAVADELQDAWRDLPADQHAGVLTRLAEALAQCRKRADRDALLQLADATGFCELGAACDLLLARQSLDTRQPETAEYHLRRAAERAVSQPAAAEICARLVRLLTASGPSSPIARPSAARPFLARLATLDPKTPLPPDLLLDNRGGGESDVAAFLATCPPVGPAGDSPTATAAAAGALEVSQRAAHLGTALRVETWPPSSGAAPGDELLRRTPLIVTSEGIVGLDAPRDDGQPRWRVDLEIPFSDLGIDLRSVSPVDAPGPAVVSGSIAAVPTARGVAFVGLLTGQVVAAPCVLADSARRSGRPVAAAGGMFVVRVNDNTLVGLPARQDARPQWRLTLDAPRIETLDAAEGCIIAAAPDAARLWVIDPRDGRVRGEYDSGEAPREVTRDAAPRDGRPPPSRRMACLCGPYWITAKGRQLTARHVVAGQTVWQLVLDAPARDLCAVDEHYVGVSQASRYQLVSLRRGQPSPAVKIVDALLPPVDAAVTEDGLLLLLLRTSSQPGSREKRVDWCSVASGDVVRSQGPWADVVLTPGMLRCSSKVLPIVRCSESPAGDDPAMSALPRPAVSLAMYDKSSGAMLGSAMRLQAESKEDESQGLRVVDVILEADRAILVTELQRWICHFGEPLR